MIVAEIIVSPAKHVKEVHVVDAVSIVVVRLLVAPLVVSVLVLSRPAVCDATPCSPSRALFAAVSDTATCSPSAARLLRPYPSC